MPDKTPFLSDDWTSILTKIIHDYKLFSEQPPPLEAKEFTSYHNACKAALAHILLLKKMTDNSSASPSEPDLFTLLDNARKATHDSNDADDSFD